MARRRRHRRNLHRSRARGRAGSSPRVQGSFGAADPAQGAFDASRPRPLSGSHARCLRAARACNGLFVHGSTIATNTVLEGKAARVGLLVTDQAFATRSRSVAACATTLGTTGRRIPRAVPRFLRRRPARPDSTATDARLEALRPADVRHGPGCPRFVRAKKASKRSQSRLFNSYLDDRHRSKRRGS